MSLSPITPSRAEMLLDAMRSQDPPPADLLSAAGTLSKDAGWRGALIRTAARFGQFAALESLMAQGFSPMADGGLAALIAAEAGDSKTLTVLLSHGVPALALDGELLAGAAGSGHLASVQVILSHCEHEPSARILQGALTAALANGATQVVHLLLGRRRNSALSDSQWQDLSAAAVIPGEAAAIEAFNELIEAGLPHEVMSGKSLPDAVSSDAGDLVRFLLSRGASPDHSDYLALRESIRRNNFECQHEIKQALAAAGLVNDALFAALRAHGHEDYATLIECESVLGS